MRWFVLIVLAGCFGINLGSGQGLTLLEEQGNRALNSKIIILGAIGHFEFVQGSPARIERVHAGSIDLADNAFFEDEAQTRLVSDFATQSMSCVEQNGALSVSMGGAKPLTDEDFPSYRVFIGDATRVELRAHLAWVTGVMPKQIAVALGGCSRGTLQGESERVSISLEGSARFEVGRVGRLELEASGGARVEVAEVFGGALIGLSGSSRAEIDKAAGLVQSVQSGGTRLHILNSGDALILHAKTKGASRLNTQGVLASLSLKATDASRVIVEQVEKLESLELQRAAQARIGQTSHDARAAR